jgi:hypothetical protein
MRPRAEPSQATHRLGFIAGSGLYRWLFRLVLLGSRRIAEKKQGATGITTVAPYIAGQWGRGE